MFENVYNFSKVNFFRSISADVNLISLAFGRLKRQCFLSYLLSVISHYFYNNITTFIMAHFVY